MGMMQQYLQVTYPKNKTRTPQAKINSIEKKKWRMIKKQFVDCADANHKANQSKYPNTSDNPIMSMLTKITSDPRSSNINKILSVDAHSK